MFQIVVLLVAYIVMKGKLHRSIGFLSASEVYHKQKRGANGAPVVVYNPVDNELTAGNSSANPLRFLSTHS